MLVYVCLYIKYNNCSTVNKLNASKTDLRFDSVMLSILKSHKWQKKLNVATLKYFFIFFIFIPKFLFEKVLVFYIYSIKIEYH